MRRYLHLISILAFCLPMLVLALFARAADPDRTLHTFDFEERRLGNVEDVPMHWHKVTGPDLPHYVGGKFSTDRCRSAKHSFRMDLNGGGVLYRYQAGMLKVQEGAYYRVEAWCQTTLMPRARARLSAYFADADGRPIKDSIRHSEPYSAKSPDEGWKRLEVELSADNPDAKSLVVELGLLQPQHFAQTTLGARALHTQDIRGTAWFDDVSVSQVPRVTLTTDQPGNLFRRGEPLRVNVLVNDRFTDDLSAQLVIKDATGRVVYQRSGALDIRKAGQITPGQKRMTLELPELPPGWYDAALVMSSQGQTIGEESLHFIHLPDASATPSPDGRFGLIATDLPFDGWSQLPDLLPLLAAGRVKLAVWSANWGVGAADDPAFDTVLERLGEKGIVPTACLTDVPPWLAPKLYKDRTSNEFDTAWPRLLKTDPAVWKPELAYLVSRHANHLDRWQLGVDGSDAFVTQPVMREVYQSVYREFSNLVEKPDLAMPWPAWSDQMGDAPATVALSVPPTILPSQLPLYVDELSAKNAGGSTDSRPQNLSLSLQLLPREPYGREVQIRDLAQRVVYALVAGATRIDLPLPFTVQRKGDTVVQQPQEMLLIVRTLTTTLGQAEYKGRVSIAEGIEAFVFDRNGQGIMAVWDRNGATKTQRELPLNLGENPVAIDLWGNVTPLLKAPGGATADPGAVMVPVSQTPIFLVNIDGYAAQLRASVVLDRPLLESSFRPHLRKLKFVNPYPTAIAGTVKLKPPGGWKITPATIQFNLNPGEVFERDITLEFPFNSIAGNKTISADFSLQGDASSFTVPLMLKLGLSDVGMRAIALRDGDDVIVQQMVSNYGDNPVNYNAFALFPRQARQERLITNLGAGQTTVRRYRFKNVSITEETKVRLGLREVNGSRVLNDEVPVQ